MASFLRQSGNPGIFYATVNEQDMMYMPSGWAFAEQNGNKSNLGLRIPTLVRGEALAAVVYCTAHIAKSAKFPALEKAIKDCWF